MDIPSQLRIEVELLYKRRSCTVQISAIFQLSWNATTRLLKKMHFFTCCTTRSNQIKIAFPMTQLLQLHVGIFCGKINYFFREFDAENTWNMKTFMVPIPFSKFVDWKETRLKSDSVYDRESRLFDRSVWAMKHLQVFSSLHNSFQVFLSHLKSIQIFQSFLAMSFPKLFSSVISKFFDKSSWKTRPTSVQTHS